MDNILANCELRINTYNLDEVPDYTIKEIIKNSNKEDAILEVLLKCYFQVNTDKKQDSFDYFIDLVDKIAKVSGYDYSEDELNIYKAFAIPMDYKNTENEEVLSSLLKRYEDVDAMTVTGENLLYAQEYVRYNLLLIYSYDIRKYNDKMRPLLAKLRANHDNYVKLRDTIYKKIQ